MDTDKYGLCYLILSLLRLVIRMVWDLTAKTQRTQRKYRKLGDLCAFAVEKSLITSNNAQYSSFGHFLTTFRNYYPQYMGVSKTKNPYVGRSEIVGCD
jgi:hypothetical protein